MPDPADPPEAPQTIPAEHSHGAEQRGFPRAANGWRAVASENRRTIGAVALLAIGITLVTLGWYGAAYTNIITEQIPYMISGGLLGLGLIIVAGFMAFSAVSERDNRLLREEIIRALRAGGGSVPQQAREAASTSNGLTVFVVPGGRSFHHAGCPIIEGKPDVRELVPADAAGSGYVACKLCDTGD